MMNIRDQLLCAIRDRQLLDHPFYRDWMKGKLRLEQLRHYATQYFPHVQAFPRFVSAVHSLCEDNSARKSLFLNLCEEEGAINKSDHPELWLRFAEGLGVPRDDVRKSNIAPKAQALVDAYFELCRSSYSSGLGALIAYEYQIPAIAQAKIDGLIKLYGVEDDRTLSFFEIHKTADQFHSETCMALLESLPENEQEIALISAQKSAQALWDFLTEVYENKNQQVSA